MATRAGFVGVLGSFAWVASGFCAWVAFVCFCFLLLAPSGLEAGLDLGAFFVAGLFVGFFVDGTGAQPRTRAGSTTGGSTRSTATGGTGTTVAAGVAGREAGTVEANVDTSSCQTRSKIE